MPDFNPFPRGVQEAAGAAWDSYWNNNRGPGQGPTPWGTGASRGGAHGFSADGQPGLDDDPGGGRPRGRPDMGGEHQAAPGFLGQPLTGQNPSGFLNFGGNAPGFTNFSSYLMANPSGSGFGGSGKAGELDAGINKAYGNTPAIAAGSPTPTPTPLGPEGGPGGPPRPGGGSLGGGIGGAVPGTPQGVQQSAGFSDQLRRGRF